MVKIYSKKHLKIYNRKYVKKWKILLEVIYKKFYFFIFEVALSSNVFKIIYIKLDIFGPLLKCFVEEDEPFISLFSESCNKNTEDIEKLKLFLCFNYKLWLGTNIE